MRDSTRKVLSKAEKRAFDLGRRLDEGIRPADVYRFFDVAVDVPIDPPPDGPYCSVKGLSQRRLEWRSPQPGELEPDDTWLVELQDLLTKNEILNAGAEILAAWKKEGQQDRIISMSRIVELLDSAIREHLGESNTNDGEVVVPIIHRDAQSAVITLHGMPYPVEHETAEAFEAMIKAKGQPVGLSNYVRKPKDWLEKLKKDAPELAAIVARAKANTGYRLTIFDAPPDSA